MEIQSVSTLSIIGMIFSFLIAFGVPITLLVVIRKKTKARVSSFFIGCVTFVLFAMILESIMHSFVFSATGNAISGNIWAYALYGGLAASLFEETGRFLAMKFCMKKALNRENALMYGAGHGGIEAILLVGFTYISNIIMAILANTGTMEKSLTVLDSATYDQTVSQLSVLWTTSSSLFFLAGVERLAAITLHISLSIFVYKTVKTGNVKYLLVAYLLHFAVDAGTLLLTKVLSSVWIEVVLLVVVAVIAYFAVKLYQEESVANKIQPQD
ncbi:MAG TPA: YhfC family glutamic-type intramembrane protease [Lachnospiraceae bacterium]|nr:YhfC family glutamic-type intramembrane protease [Lachnospiraceae bacterium]